MSKVRKSKILSIVVIIAIISTLVSSIGSFTASADVVYYTDGENYNFAVSNGEATITEYIGNGGDITIPSTIYGYPVTAIGNNAFSDCDSLTSVDTSNVTTIGDSAFSSCWDLVSIDMPNVTTIGNFAFSWCMGLSSVNMPSVVTLGTSVFNSCTKLESVHLPKSLKSNDYNPFGSCTKLNKITIDSKNEYYCVEDDVLFNKDKTELICYPVGKPGLSYTVPDTVVKIGGRAFDSSSLMYINMPNVTEVGINAFLYAFSLTNVDMPNATTIKDCAFYYCSGLVSVNMPKVETIGDHAFFECSTLTSVDMPNVTTIEYNAFYNCSALTSVSMPNVTEIGNNAFYVYGGSELTIYGYADSYAHRYADYYGINFSALSTTIKNVSYEHVGGKVIFTVTTDAGDYNRIKVTTADNLRGSLGVAITYTVNADGNYVWTIKTNAPTETTEYAFDLRSSETGKYLKDYYICEAEIIPTIKSVSHEKVNGKMIFTVVTSAGNYNRIKVTNADNLSGSLAVANSYTINADGDYVWTIKATAPTETTEYAFDLRSSETGKYLKSYYKYEAEIVPTIKSATYEIVNGKVIFTVVTGAGNYNRVKLTTADNLRGSLITRNSYVIDSDGNYVWTIKFNAPTEATTYAFDVRSSETSKYIKEYYCLTVTTPDEYASARKEGVINSPVTKTVSMYKVNTNTFEIGAKQNRTITFKGTIKIGNTAASTGAFASVGMPFNAGLESYINKINFNGGIGGDYASGKQGYYIEFINYDDGFSGDLGATYTKKLVEEDKIFALVGQFGSPTVGATIDYIKEQGVIACYMASSIGELYNEDADTVQSGSTLFPVQPIYTTEGRIMVGRIIEQYPDAKKIGVIYTSDEIGLDIKDGAVTQVNALGSNYECVISEAESYASDYTTVVNKIADCDVVIVASIQRDTVSILKSMITNGVYKPVFTSYSVASSQTLVEIKPYYDALDDADKFPIYANAWLSATDIESYLDFATDVMSFEGSNNTINNSYAMAGWIAAKTFCEGIERVIDSGKEINNLTFVEAMESETVTLPMSSGATLDYSDGYRFGTTTMSLLKNNATCNSFEEVEAMKDFYDFIKTGNTSSL